MVLENYVKLTAEAEKILKLENPRILERTITDPETKRPKIVRAWVADVTEEDYAPVRKIFSTLAEKLAASLQVAADAGDLRRYRVGITWYPRGYATEYRMRLI